MTEYRLLKLYLYKILVVGRQELQSVYAGINLRTSEMMKTSRYFLNKF